MTVQLLETVVVSSGASGATVEPGAGLVAFLRHVGRVRANEIRLYDSDDRLLYESPPSVYKQGRWAPEWFASLVRPPIGDFRLNLRGGTIVVTPAASRKLQI